MQILKKCFDLKETTFFVQTSEMGQLLQKNISPQNEPHTAKLSFAGVLKRF